MKRVLVAIICFAAAAPLCAASNDGGTGWPILRMGPGAAAMGRGGAGIALDSSACSIYGNPAGLAGIRPSYELGYESLIAGNSRQYLSFSNRTKKLFTSVGLNTWSTGSITETTWDAPDGTGRFFTAGETGLSAAVAQRRGRTRVGAAVRLTSGTIDSLSSSALTLDAGAVKTLNDFSIAVLIQNIGMVLDPYLVESAPLPSQASLGVAYTGKPSGQNRVNMAVDMIFAPDTGIVWRMGLEAVFNRRIFLRAGIDRMISSGATTLGFGFEGKDGFHADLAWIFPSDSLGSAFGSHMLMGMGKDL